MIRIFKVTMSSPCPWPHVSMYLRVERMQVTAKRSMKGRISKDQDKRHFQNPFHRPLPRDAENCVKKRLFHDQFRELLD